MRIFLTGGTGFIGSHFINSALAAGHEIVAQRRPHSRPRIPILREPFWIDRHLDQDFDRELAGCDVLVHFAAHMPDPAYAQLEESVYWNTWATVRLLQHAEAQGIKHFLIAGSCFEYGRAAIGQEFIHPASPVMPSSPYAISKAAASTACVGFARQLKLRLQVLRIFQAFGEGEAPTRFWPSLKDAALKGENFAMSSGQQIRDFVPVAHVAREFLRNLDFEGVEPGRPHIKNIGTGRAQTLLEFALYWWRHWGAKGQLRPGEVALRGDELERLVANVNAIAIG